MPSCSGNKKATMTGGGVRSMLRRAKSGLRKLTKRNKSTRNEAYEMVDLSPKIATTRFGSKSKYNNRMVHRMGVADLERYVKQLQEEVKELTQQSEIAQTAHGQCMDREAKRLGNPALTKELEVAVEKLAKAEKQLETERDEVRRLYDANSEANRKLMYTEKELESAVAKLSECESGKSSLGRRHAAAAKMYRQAHVDRTLGALETEEALDKTIEAEELLAKAQKQAATLQAQYDRATAHAGTKSEKVTELTMKLGAANAKVAKLESNLASAERRTQRRFPVSKQNIARGASSMSLMRTMRNTNAVAKEFNSFMAQQKQNHNTMTAYRASRHTNAASLERTKSKAAALEKNNALTRSMKKKIGGK